MAINKYTQFAELDGLLHQPVRTRIAAFLAARGETSFTELKRALDLTDGNLDAHMKKLVNAGYIHIRRAQDSPRTQTVYTLSETGRQAFVDYVNALEQLLMRK